MVLLLSVEAAVLSVVNAVSSVEAVVSETVSEVDSVKVKYLAYVDAALFVLGVVTTSFPLNLLPVVAVLNYLVYCGDWLFDLFRPSHVRQRQKTVNFKREARRIQREQANKPYHYKCAVCGRTDVDHPELEFRYCSRCVGYHCFCQDHINNHIHFTE